MFNEDNGKNKKLDQLLKWVTVVVALGTPFIALINMTSTYKERLNKQEEQLEVILQRLDRVEGSTNLQLQNNETFKQGTTINRLTLDKYYHLQENMEIKVDKISQQSIENKVKIDNLQTEVFILRNQRRR